MLVFQPFMNPTMLHYNLDILPDGPNEVTSLVIARVWLPKAT